MWGVLGAIAEATERLRVGTAVTCPTIRIHPALVAQAVATAEQLMPGRFFLGLGSGENLNEHILGDRWPPTAERRDMLAEAVEVMRKLWGGGNVTHRGTYFRVQDARVYSLPERPPPIYLAASGKRAARLAGEVADGLIGLAPDPDLLTTFEHAGGVGKPKLAEINLCWARDEADAVKTTLEWGPNALVAGELVAELPLPRHFEQAAQMITEDDVRQKLVMGADPERHLEVIQTYLDAGSITSGSTRSAPTRRASSSSTRPRSCRSSAQVRARRTASARVRRTPGSRCRARRSRRSAWRSRRGSCPAGPRSGRSGP